MGYKRVTPEELAALEADPDYRIRHASFIERLQLHVEQNPPKVTVWTITEDGVTKSES